MPTRFADRAARERTPTAVRNAQSERGEERGALSVELHYLGMAVAAGACLERPATYHLRCESDICRWCFGLELIVPYEAERPNRTASE
jgi:hypothetical protein